MFIILIIYYKTVKLTFRISVLPKIKHEKWVFFLNKEIYNSSQQYEATTTLLCQILANNLTTRSILWYEDVWLYPCLYLELPCLHHQFLQKQTRCCLSKSDTRLHIMKKKFLIMQLTPYLCSNLWEKNIFVFEFVFVFVFVYHINICSDVILRYTTWKNMISWLLNWQTLTTIQVLKSDVRW